MQLSKTEDFEAPRDAVFRVLADMDHWERMALRRGIDVQRLDSLPAPAPGMAWKAAFPFRGSRREVQVRIDRLDPGQTLYVSGAGKALEGAVRLDLTEMGPRRTRVTVTVEVGARTLAARLFLQSLRLAPAKVKSRFDGRISAFAAEIQTRLRNAPRAS